MNAIEAKIEQLQNLDTNISDQFKLIIENNEEIIISYNIYNQLFLFGETSTGIELSSFAPYAPMTINFKIQKHQPIDRVTLKDTGAFYKSFYVIADNEGFVIRASDPKAEALAFKYGEDIFGLSPSNLEDFQQYFRPALLEILKTLL